MGAMRGRIAREDYEAILDYEVVWRKGCEGEDCKE